MNPFTLEYLREQYKKIQLMRKTEKSEIWLVSDSDGNLFVMKTIYSTGLPLKQLKDHPSRFWPQIHLLHEDAEQKYTLVIEEFILGKTLEAVIDSRKITPSTASKLFREFCRGLKELHELGIIHRDIKPSNIVIKNDGSPVLIDFDSARLASDGKNKTSDTVLLGTKGYAPPEQFGYSTTDVRSDIYALGVTFDKLLPADSPFMLRRIVRKCRAFDPDNRYQSADEILRALSYARLIKLFGGILLFAVPSLLLIKFIFFPMSQKPAEEPAHEQEYSTQQHEEKVQPASEGSGTNTGEPKHEQKNSAQQHGEKVQPSVENSGTDTEEKLENSAEKTDVTQSAVDNAENGESHHFAKPGFGFGYDSIIMEAAVSHNSHHRGKLPEIETVLYDEYSKWTSTPTESPIYREITFPDDWAVEVVFTNNSKTVTWENPEVEIAYDRNFDYDHRETRSLPDLPPGESYTLVYSLAGMKTRARFMYSGGGCVDISFTPNFDNVDKIGDIKQTMRGITARINFNKDIT